MSFRIKWPTPDEMSVSCRGVVLKNQKPNKRKIHHVNNATVFFLWLLSSCARSHSIKLRADLKSSSSMYFNQNDKNCECKPSESCLLFFCHLLFRINNFSIHFMSLYGFHGASHHCQRGSGGEWNCALFCQQQIFNPLTYGLLSLKIKPGTSDSPSAFNLLKGSFILFKKWTSSPYLRTDHSEEFYD